MLRDACVRCFECFVVLRTKEKSKKRSLSEFDEMTQELPWYMKAGSQGSQDKI